MYRQCSGTRERDFKPLIARNSSLIRNVIMIIYLRNYIDLLVDASMRSIACSNVQ